MKTFPALGTDCFDTVIAGKLADSVAPPRFLILYGSVRQRSFSRFCAEEAGRLLAEMGAEVKIFNPSGLPLPDDAPETHPKVQELRSLVRWCDGMVWSSPERHGAMSSILKAQMDWIPLTEGAIRPSKIHAEIQYTLDKLKMSGLLSQDAVVSMHSPRKTVATIAHAHGEGLEVIRKCWAIVPLNTHAPNRCHVSAKCFNITGHNRSEILRNLLH